MWLSGRHQPITCAHSGSAVNGKKMPPNRNMGVITPVQKMLKCSMFEVNEV